MKILPFTLALLLSSAFLAYAQQPAPKFTTISVPGALETDAYGIGLFNNVIVGSYVDQNGTRHGFEMKGTQVMTVDDPNGTDTVCTGIDSSGGIVGYYTAPDDNSRGFYFDSETYKDIGPPGAISSVAYGINQLEEVAGAYQAVPGGAWQGFFFDGVKYTTINIPGASNTWAYGVGGQGVSVIWLDTNGHYQSSFCGPLLHCRSINVPGALNTFAHSVDYVGDIAFGWQDINNNYHAAVLAGGVFYKFEEPSGNSTQAFGINGRDVVGQYLPTGGTTPASFAGKSCPPLCHP